MCQNFNRIRCIHCACDKRFDINIFFILKYNIQAMRHFKCFSYIFSLTDLISARNYNKLLFFSRPSQNHVDLCNRMRTNEFERSR